MVLLPEELVEAFASLARARPTRTGEPERERQPIARQARATLLAPTCSPASVAFDSGYDRWSP